MYYLNCCACGVPLPENHSKNQKYCCEACRLAGKRERKRRWDLEHRTPKNTKRREVRAKKKEKEPEIFPSVVDVATEARKRGISYGKMSILLEMERWNGERNLKK